MDDLFDARVIEGSFGQDWSGSSPVDVPADDVPVDGRRRAGELIRMLSDVLTELGEIPISQFSGDEQLAFSEDLLKQSTRLGAISDLTLAAIQKERSWEGRGVRTFPDFVRRTSKSTQREASKTVKRAQVLEEKLPAFKKAFADGDISAEKIDTVNRYLKTPELTEKLSDPKKGEGYLLNLAKTHNGDLFQREMKSWAIENAPGAAEKEQAERVREQNVTLVPDADGFRLSGWLTTLNGELLNTALTAVMGVPTQGDPTGPKARRAAALVEIATRHLDDGLSNSAATVRPHLSIHVPFEILDAIAPSQASASGHAADEAARCSGSRATGRGQVDVRQGSAGSGSAGSGSARKVAIGGIQAPCIDQIRDDRKRLGQILTVIRAGIDEDLLTGSPPATLDDGTPIVHSELQALLCSGEMQRVVLTDDGDVLDVGKTHRLATKAQTRAVVARDRTCRYPGCTHTMSSSEIHHADHWSNGGATDIDNLVMLCWFHHQEVHRTSTTITHHEFGWSFDTPREHVGITEHASPARTHRGADRAEGPSADRAVDPRPDRRAG